MNIQHDILNHYIEAGHGKPLLLFHGNGEDSSYFKHQIEYFSPHYRVIAVDTRWHGSTPRGTAPFTLTQFADDFYALMRHLGLDKAHILGFSDGGNIAMLLAIKHPECVDKLILAGANMFPTGLKSTELLPMFPQYCKALLGQHKRRAALLRLMMYEPIIEPKDLQRITAPTLVIAGEDDMVVQSHTELIAKSLPNSRLCILPGDHFISRKQPQPFNEAVAAFLAE